MSPSSTSTSVHTRTQTATYLTDVVMGTIADILGHLRIDLTPLYRDWKQDEAAIAAWIVEGSLALVVLECHHPDGTVAPVVEFPVTYRDGVGDAKFTADRAALARYRAKLEAVPRGSSFALFCSFNGRHSDQPGWIAGSRSNTDHLTPARFGTLAAAPHASMEMRYLRRP